MQGLLLINKPEGMTSFSVVSRVKRFANEKRVGHTGTLDPMATGVLLVLLGKATALSSLVLDSDKRYIAKIKLGVKTDTDDITGEIISEKAVSVTNEQLFDALEHFKGAIEQTPPIYSAIKKDGVRLYKLAREGKSAEIPSRTVEIHDIKLLSPLNGENEFEIDTYVSKGTYIRSLARDIGEYLGCGATLSALQRTYAGGFDISQCVELSDIEANGVGKYILNEELAVSHLRELRVSQKQAVRFCNGGQLGFDRLKVKEFSDGELFRIKLEDRLLGVGFANLEKQEIGIKCVIADRGEL